MLKQVPSLRPARVISGHVLRLMIITPNSPKSIVNLSITAMNVVPLNIPICLRSHMGKIMQNALFTRHDEAYCRNHNLDAWEQMLLLPTDDGKIIVQSRFNGRNLQVSCIALICGSFDA